MESVQCSYDEYLGRPSDPSETIRETDGDGVSLQELLKQALQRNQAASPEDMTEGVLSSGWKLIQSVGRAVLVKKNVYALHVRGLANDLLAARRGAEAATEKLAAQEDKVSKLKVKVHLLAEDPGCAGDLRRGPNAKIREFNTFKKDWESKISAVKRKSGFNGCLRLELETAHAVIGHGDGEGFTIMPSRSVPLTPLKCVSRPWAIAIGLMLCWATSRRAKKILEGSVCALMRIEIHCIIGKSTVMSSLGVGPLCGRTVTVVILLLCLSRPVSRS